MPNTIPKILIISSDTGGGHRSAAAALVEGVNRFWEGDSKVVRVIKGVEESHHITDKLVNSYNWILRNKQHWMKYLYWVVNIIRPEKRNFFYRRCVPYFVDAFDLFATPIESPNHNRANSIRPIYFRTKKEHHYHK